MNHADIGRVGKHAEIQTLMGLEPKQLDPILKAGGRVGKIGDAYSIADGVMEQQRSGNPHRLATAIGGAAGGGAGVTAGAAIGTLIAPGPGTVIGGVVGGYLGSLAGEQVAGESISMYYEQNRNYLWQILTNHT